MSRRASFECTVLVLGVSHFCVNGADFNLRGGAGRRSDDRFLDETVI